MSDRSKERVTITLDPGIVRQVDQISDRRGESRSAIIERVLRYALEDYEKHLKSLENPVTRAIVRGLTQSPEVLQVIAKIAGESLSRGDIAELQARARSDEEFAVERRRKRRVQKRGSE